MNGIEQLKGKYRMNNRAWLLANGPGLNDIDLDWVQRTGYPIFGLNRIYLKLTPTVLVVVNDLVIDQWKDEISQVDCIKILPERWADRYDWDDRTYFVNTSRSELVFEKDLTQGIWEGHTVTFAAQQVAKYLGISMLLTVGLDHDFGKIDAAPNEQMVRMREPDLAHFDEEYFPPGSLWNAPDLGKSELAYILTRAEERNLMQDPLWVINLSSRSKWRGFEMRNINELRHQLKDPSVKTPRVTAIVSAYHSKKYIKGCIDDLMGQTLWDKGELEIVVVCKKRSAEARYCKKKNLKVIETDNVPTVYEAWNMAIKEATGEYITNANTDDRHAANALEIQMKALDALEHVDLVYYNSFVTWEDNQTFDEFFNSVDPMRLVPGRVEGEPGLFLWPDYSKQLLTRGCFIGPHPMWRHRLHQLHGYFNEDLKSAGDYEFWLRIAKEDNIYHISANLGLYLARPDGIELSDPELSAMESRAAIELHQEQTIDLNVVDSETVMLSIGDKYAMLDVDQLHSVLERIRTERGSEVDKPDVDVYHEEEDLATEYRG